MTFSKTEKRIVAGGVKLSIALGFLACLAFVGSWFLGPAAGPKVTLASGCLLSLAAVAGLYLGVCQAVIEARGKRDGA